MIRTIILGKRSALSDALLKKIDNAVVIGSEEIKKIDYKKLPKRFNLIINLFYSTKKINKIEDYDQFFSYSIYFLNKFFSNIKIKQINKVIYSSSSAVYGDLVNNLNKRNLYASAKVLVENYLKNLNYINKKLIIARLFNLYESNENFSIISKIIYHKKAQKKIPLYNNGEGIRDFIKISDVVKIYKKLLSSKFSGSIDVGSGKGVQIKNLLECVDLKYISIKNPDEQKISIANISKLTKIYPDIKLYNLNKFFYKSDISLKKKINKIILPHEKENQINRNIIVIYGAGFSGKKLYEQIKSSSKKTNIFFIDDKKRLQGKYYKESPIISYNKFLEIKKVFEIKNIFLAIPSLDAKKKNKILKNLSKFNDLLMILPPKNQIINDQIFFKDLKKINYLDILNRKTSPINNKLIKYLNNSNVLITGAAGSIGSELLLQISKTKVNKIICLDINETELFRLKQSIKNNKNITYIISDIKNQSNMEKIIKKYKVEHIFHAAAYKHVDMLENNIEAAVKNNILGTLSLIKSLNKTVKNFIFISTDKAAKPINILGVTKRFSELMCQYFSKFTKTNFSIVRFGNVFGSRGSAVEIFDYQIKNRLPITLTNYKAKRYFMSITEACNLVMQCSQINSKGDVYLLNMGKQIKIYEIIKKMFKFYNLKNYPIKLIGLKKGEKLSEILSISNKRIRTSHPDIYSFKEKKIKFDQIKKIISMIENNINESLVIKNIKKIKNL